jgi:hypothetical protein
MTPTLLHEVLAHVVTTPPAALGPLLWGGSLLLALRRLRRPRVEERPAAPQTEPAADDLRPAA